MRRIFLCMCALLVAAAPFLYTYKSYAAGEILYFSPESSQLSMNSSTTINVKAFSGSSGQASGSVTYPANLLRMTATSAAGSDYGSPTIATGNGVINFSGSSTKAGQKHIFSITFQAIGAGTATLSFSPNSTISYNAPTRKTATITVPAPPAPTPTPAPAPTPTPAPAPTPTPAPAPTPIIEETPASTDTEEVTEPDSTGLIENVGRTGDYTSAKITWTLSDILGDASLSYGISSDKTNSKATVTRGADGAFSTTLEKLNPGARYYFTITATAPGDKTGTYSGTIYTLGYPVAIKVTQASEPLVNAKIQIGQQQYATSKDGISSLSLASGEYSIVVSDGTSTKTETITVEKKDIPIDGSAPATQTFSFDLPPSSDKKTTGGLSILTFIGVLIGGLALVAVAFLVFVTVRRRRYEKGVGYAGIEPATTVVIDDGYKWHADDDYLNNASPPTPPPLTPPIDQIQQPIHNNSVYLDEDEPKDMFELAKEQTPPADETSTLPNAIDAPTSQPRTPNAPHSTTP